MPDFNHLTLGAICFLVNDIDLENALKTIYLMFLFIHLNENKFNSKVYLTTYSLVIYQFYTSMVLQFKRFIQVEQRERKI